MDEQTAAEALLACVNVKQPREPLYPSPVQRSPQRTTAHGGKNLAPLLHAAAQSQVYNPIHSSQPIQSTSSHSRSPPGYTQSLGEQLTPSNGAAGAPKKRGRSAESNPVDSEPVEEVDEDNDDATKPLKNTKRAAQNRAAQRAFRERKEQYVRDLERKSTLLDETLTDKRTLSAQLAEVQAELASIKSNFMPPSNNGSSSAYPVITPISQRPYPGNEFGGGGQVHQSQAQNGGYNSSEFERRAKEWTEERAELLLTVEQEHHHFVTEREANKIERESHLVTQGKLEESRRECLAARTDFVSACAARK